MENKEESTQIKNLIEAATFDHVLENSEEALRKLDEALAINKNSFDAWLAKAEIFYSLNHLDQALETAQIAYKLNPEDPYIHTSLSRIWVAKGNKEKAEFFGAQAKMMHWKETLKKS